MILELGNFLADTQLLHEIKERSSNTDIGIEYTSIINSIASNYDRTVIPPKLENYRIELVISFDHTCLPTQMERVHYAPGMKSAWQIFLKSIFWGITHQTMQHLTIGRFFCITANRKRKNIK